MNNHLVTCSSCGREWDGNAQCNCYLDMYLSLSDSDREYDMFTPPIRKHKKVMKDASTQTDEKEKEKKIEIESEIYAEFQVNVAYIQKIKPEPVRKVIKEQKTDKPAKPTRKSVLEKYDPTLCGVRKSGAWWLQCGREIPDGEFVCKKCDNIYHKTNHWFRAGHMEVWGEYSLSSDPEFWGHKHGKWEKSPAQKWLVEGELEDDRDEGFKEAYPIEVPVIDESSSDEDDSDEKVILTPLEKAQKAVDERMKRIINIQIIV